LNNLDLGKQGELEAAKFLESKGYKIISRNFKCSLGEIDIIAQDKDTYCFIEVKARSSRDFGLPQEAVSRIKQRQISKAALVFLKENKLLDKKARFDVVSVIFKENSPEFDLITNAFELEESYSY